MENFSEFITANWELVIALVIILALIARNLIMPARINPVVSMEAIRLMNQQNALVLDIRSNDEYQKGHILNSMHIPLALIDSKQSELLPFKNEQIILCCRSGNRSYQAGLTLKKLGFENLHNLKGGILAWEQAGLPLTTKPTKGKHKLKKKIAPTVTVSEQNNDTSQQDSLAKDVEGSSRKNADGSSRKNADGSLSTDADGSLQKSADDSTQKSADGSTQKSADGSGSSQKKTENASGNEVVVYTTKLCPFCDRAVNLLSEKGIGYTEIRIDGEPTLREEMEKKSMRKTVPQIFVGETHVGGFDDMYMLESKGQLNTVFGLS